MLLLNTPTYCSISAAPVGALIVSADEPTDFGIFLQMTGTSPTVGWMQTRLPTLKWKFSYLQSTAKCFSFGANWLLESDLSKGVDASIDDVGALVLGPDGPEFKFRGTGEALGVTYVFNGAGTASSAGDRIRIKAWRIWSSDDARYGPDAKPLIDSF